MSVLPVNVSVTALRFLSSGAAKIKSCYEDTYKTTTCDVSLRWPCELCWCINTSQPASTMASHCDNDSQPPPTSAACVENTQTFPSFRGQQALGSMSYMRKCMHRALITASSQHLRHVQQTQVRLSSEHSIVQQTEKAVGFFFET
jgi:hypothetical protein